MSSLNVLYDAPGPKAKRRNLILSVIFAVLLLWVVYIVLVALNDKGQLDSEKWSPFLHAEIWSTYLLPGLWQTVRAALLSLVIALPVGALLAVGRLSDHRVISAPCTVIIEFFRAIPVLLLMVFAKVIFVAAEVGSEELRPLLAVVTGLVLYNASVLAEVFRSGIASLPSGQTEASLAIGLRKGQIMTIILLPQALTAMLPAIVSQLVVIVKDTALGGLLTIEYPELLRSSKTAFSNFQNVVPMFIVAALIFIALNLTLTTIASQLEKYLRNRRSGGKGSKPLLGSTETATETEVLNAPGITETDPPRLTK
ncbi:amino acid ABC transporter permease [Nakamurella antarctica]|uniref:Amino acid ABC transporter permease n=1 Tax=Nakamurella antarctica TaxID=1902245 RepID=A0A3G8ZJW4_9ACTN|nr:amino acid ABC transporter permease [Nakamurella antarctica]AZI57642.1 amino acid ABC transporter permease [Nakamurella antarctica]